MEKSKRTKTILITGGAGFIGTNISLEAVSRGYDVVVLDNLSRKGSEENLPLLKSMGVGVIRGDVTRPETIPNIEPDGVIHLAANTGIGVSIDNPNYDFCQNAVGTLNMLELARMWDVPLIYASTNKVYSGEVNEIDTTEGTKRYTWGISGVDESFRTDGEHHTPYGASKLTGDMYCQEYFNTFATQTVVNRMSCIYGWYQNGAEEQGWVDHFIRSNMFGSGKVNIYGDGKQVRDVLWGGDVARLYLDELENIDICAGQVFNVGGGNENTLSLLECMDKISDITETAFVPEYCGWRLADQKMYISDITKVKSVMGWSPKISPEEGINLMIERYNRGINRSS